MAIFCNFVVFPFFLQSHFSVRNGFSVTFPQYEQLMNVINLYFHVSGLGMVLRSRQIDAVFVCGLAYDVCVAATAFHAVDRGFFTLLITDCR